MNFTDGLKSSNTDEWETPQHLFNYLDLEFNFEIDVCANEHNHKCKIYYDKDIDGLSQDWGTRRCWMNPPYGREICKWVKKAADTAMWGGRSCGTVTRAHRYPMVASCDESDRITLYPWTRKIWKCESRRTIPQCHSDMGNADKTRYKND